LFSVGYSKVFVENQWIDLINKGLTLTVKTGGSYEPTECRARYNVAIVVPYRDREAHLKAFLANLHPFLQRQQLAYTIFIVEQTSIKKYRSHLIRYFEFNFKSILQKILLCLIVEC